MWNAMRFAFLVFPLLTCAGLATDDVPDIPFQTVDLGGIRDARVRLKVRTVLVQRELEFEQAGVSELRLSSLWDRVECQATALGS